MTAPRYAEMLAGLIAIDTTSRRSNLPLLDHVETYLGAFDCRFRRIGGQDEGKANLWVTIGPEDQPGYVLSGHCDTVPVDGQAWTSDPFTLREAGGRLHGRGTADMKGFLAVCLAKMPEMAAAVLKRPIHLAISYDEEVGCRGVRPLIAALDGLACDPLGCFVGEPTRMAVVTGHKGKHAYRTIVTGSAGHSSVAPRHVNAVEYAARLIEEIRRMALRIAEEWPRDPRYDIPHSTLLTTTIQGGVALNVVPERCVLDWECRLLPEDELAGLPEMIMAYARRELLPAMRAIRPEAALDVEALFSYPGLDTDDGHPLVRLAQRLAGRNELRRVAFGTEAGLYDQAGIPSVVIGPGSIEQAHKADEFIEMEQLEACGDFVSALIAECCR